MNILIPATILAGYEFTEDANGLIHVTKDRLNLLGAPTAAFSLPNGSILEPEFTVGVQSVNDIVLSVQAKTFMGDDFQSPVMFDLWLSDIAASELTTPLDEVAFSQGIAFDNAGNMNTRLKVITNSNGTLTCTFTSSTPRVVYANTVINNIIFSSSEITWS